MNRSTASIEGRGGALRPRRARVAVAAALATTTLVITAACSSGGGTKAATEAEATDAQIPTLTWAVNSAPRSLDPAHAFDTSSAIVTTELLDPVLGVATDGTIEPRLAESYTQPDNKTVVLKLRQGVTFWDGKPLTAEDVVFSLSRNLDADVASEMAEYFTFMESVKATADDEVTIKLSEPDPRFIFALQYSLIQQKEYAEAHAEDLGSPTGLVMGTGAFKVESFSSATGVTMTRNDNYWGTKPKVENLEIKVVSDSDTLRLSTQSGEVDGTFQVPVENSASWDKLDDVSIKYVPGATTTFLTVNTTKAPFDDVHARRALAYALDRQGIVDALFAGHAEPADQTIVDPVLWTEQSKSQVDDFYASLPNYAFDLDKAKDELAQSATPDGFSVDVVYPNGRAYLGKMLQTLAQNVEPLGITMSVKEVPTSEWISTQRAKDRPILGISALGADYPSPATLPLAVLSPKGVGVNQNYADYLPDELVATIEEYRNGDDEQRLAALKTISGKLSEDVPYIPISYQTATVATGKGFVFDGDYSAWTLYGQEWASRIRATK